MTTTDLRQRTLGLDIGVASVGWCLLESDGDEKPSRILGVGSRIFSAGVEGDFSHGRDEPKNQKRQQARQVRRQLWRRRRRLLKLFRALVEAGLLPVPTGYDPAAVDACLTRLDADLARCDPSMADRRGAQVFHYRLRALAASRRVEPHELGRALYHLAQHRGYLSNRKAEKKDSEEQGVVAAGISGLQAKIQASGLRTLGAYFASIDPEAERIRGRWLGRNEFIIPEFEAIRTEQSKHHASLEPEHWKSIRDAIFAQRPLRSQSHLIGKCSLEPMERRCPVAYPLAQWFRVLQTVNHLRIRTMDGETQREERPLTTEEREKLLAALSISSELTWAKVKNAIGVNSKTDKFSAELGGEKKMIGSRTAASMRVAIGARWDGTSAEDQHAWIEDVLEYQNADKLIARCMKRWMCTRVEAEAVAVITIERARLNLSLRAIRNLLPHLDAGLSVQEAKIAAYPNQAGTDAPWDLLPPLQPDKIWQKHCSGGRAFTGIEIRNPAVERALSEVRKVVNAVIRAWGKPDRVRIEMARDLKKPRKEREDESKRMREQEGRREGALACMTREGFSHIADQRRRYDIEKVLLWEECNGVCPYTNQPISFEDLFGSNPRFEVEHIIPYSLCLEDGFGNKTLCEVNENRNVKRRSSPYGAYHGTTKWDGIIARVQRFRSRSAAKKLRLFLSEENGREIFGDFTERQLNDTRYASRLATDYVGLLFGGEVDRDRTRRVSVSAGGATAIMRRLLGLQGVLGGGEKNRDDHRHHAVDAIAIALTGAREVQMIARASEAAILRGEASHRMRMDAPWETFSADVKRSIEGIVVSHRSDRRLSGVLHQETNYSKPIRNVRGDVPSPETRYVRCLVAALSAKKVSSIVDAKVRKAVQEKLEALGQSDPEKAFKAAENLPTLRHADGREVPIRRVRIAVSGSVKAVGSRGTPRYIATGSNHHMAILEVLNASGAVEEYEFSVVTLLEAVGRKQRNEPIIQSNWGKDRRLAFTLRSHDMVEMEDDVGARRKAVVGSVSAKNVELVWAEDARPSGDRKKAGKAGGRLDLTRGKFFERKPTKIEVQVLGRVNRAHD